MEETEFAIPAAADLSGAAATIEAVCAECGLAIAMKSTLRSFPGSIHWHYKNGRGKGTLELTLLAVERRIWATVHTNRGGPWIETTLPKVRREIEKRLRQL